MCCKDLGVRDQDLGVSSFRFQSFRVLSFRFLKIHKVQGNDKKTV
jgi:hypothetical protein